MHTPGHARILGFTLIEVLAVVLVTSLVLTAAISFYLNLSRQAVHATESTREVRRASALIDRIASDLEHTLLVKKPKDVDPLSRPWLFVAEGHLSQAGAPLGSDQLKFIRRDSPRTLEGPGSDVAMVAYTVHSSPDGSNLALRRWSRSELPDSLDREFPRADDPASLLIADNLSFFALRFLDETGQWTDHWDSTQLTDSSELPRAVEIEVAFYDRASREHSASPDASSVHYTRLVELPMRPLDLEALLKPPGDPEDLGKRSGPLSTHTIAECIDFSKIDGGKIRGFSASDIAALTAVAQQNPAASFAPYAGAFKGHPAVNPDCR